MKGRENRLKPRGAILALCPLCQGKDEIPREVPLLANPKDPAVRAYLMKPRTCPRCNGCGRVGVK